MKKSKIILKHGLSLCTPITPALSRAETRGPLRLSDCQPSGHKQEPGLARSPTSKERGRESRRISNWAPYTCTHPCTYAHVHTYTTPPAMAQLAVFLSNTTPTMPLVDYKHASSCTEYKGTVSLNLKVYINSL